MKDDNGVRDDNKDNPKDIDTHGENSKDHDGENSEENRV